MWVLGVTPRERQKCFAQKLSCFLPINVFPRFSTSPALYELGYFPKRPCLSGLSTLAGGSLGGRVTGRWPCTPTPSTACVHFCRVKGPCPRPLGRGPHQPLDPSCVLSTGVMRCSGYGCGWKMRQGRDRKPQPEAERRERVRIPDVAFTLDPSGGRAACGKG